MSFINEYSHYFINYSYISISNWVAKRTWVTIVATLSGTFLCVGITELQVVMASNMKQ